MTTAAATWPTQQLAEFLAAVMAYTDATAALRGGMEWAAEAVEAELGAVVSEGQVVASVGFGPGTIPLAELITAARSGATTIEVAGLGTCWLVIAPLEHAENSQLLLARRGAEGFLPEEASLLRAMARSLSLTLRGLERLHAERGLRRESEMASRENQRLVGLLEDRQRLLERLFRIQTAISHRAPLQQVLEDIVAGAAELVGDPIVGVRLIDPDDAECTVLVASRGMSGSVASAIRRSPLTESLGGQAIVEDRLVVTEDYAGNPRALEPLVRERLRAAMAVPIHEDGRPVGSISVASDREGRSYSESEREVLHFFAHFAGMALRDARVVEEMRHLAYHDGLTDLPNRVMFAAQVETALVAARARGATVAVLFVDVDRFKVVNDSLGHSAGDELLMVLARRVRHSLRGGDLAARLGGDEFAILVNDVTVEGAMGVADRVLDVLRPSISLGDRQITITASVGVALSGDDAADGAALLRNADLAMYHAKRSGGARPALYQGEMHTQAAARANLEGDLRQAIAERNFTLHYQPVLDLATGEVEAVEALIRWSNGDAGMIPPADFIPLAEELGLITELGRWVLHEAMTTTRAWQTGLGLSRPPDLSVNISALQLQDPDLVHEVLQALVDTGFEARHLILEITETALMRDIPGSTAKLLNLKRLGIRLAIDDFGTGYSSIGYLRQLPIDVLKVDRIFIAGMARGADELSLTAAIVHFGQALGLDTIAEGIEEPEELAALVELGCRLGQGYHLGRPMASPEMQRFLVEAAMREVTMPAVAPQPRLTVVGAGFV